MISLNSSERTDVCGNRTVSIFSSKLAPGADIGVGITILSIVLLSVLGNGLVLVISYRRRKKMVGSELLCVNLAVVDFLCCICFYPLSILSSFNHAWLGHHVTCVYYGLGCYIFGLCGMFTIAAISVTRYLKTFYNLVYVTFDSDYSCESFWAGSMHTDFGRQLYSVSSNTLVRLASGLSEQCVKKQCCLARSCFGGRMALDLRLSQMFFCISLGFMTAWAPYAVVSFLFIFHKDNRYMAPGGFVFPALFAKSSHVYNPFIYFYFNKAFRQELRCLLRSFCPRLAGNRVGVRSATGQEGLPGGPHPIQIQLQELGMSGGGVLGEE
ncbi:opsin 8, group member c [Salvelinus alpinus]|uniref:opsin 8, group member c n=1 Tax=Salvelinus alpinus TaxID=8036 RepID=UPI0039FC3F82